MTVHYLDDQLPTQPEAAHAASEFDVEPPRHRWGFGTAQQAGETLADIGCIVFVLGAAAWAVFA